MPCSCRTKWGRPCQVVPDRLDKDGRWVCHVHDPAGLFQRQTEARRRERAARRLERGLKPRRLKEPLSWGFGVLVAPTLLSGAPRP